VQLFHALARTHASFNDPNLMSCAGLVPVMALAQRASLGERWARAWVPQAGWQDGHQ
jgi:hypothetical protein